MSSSVFLHICCGVCLGGPLEALKTKGMRVQGYFYNPNIHPFSEFARLVKPRVTRLTR